MQWAYAAPHMQVGRLGMLSAVGGCLGLAGGYVGSLYLWRGSHAADRDHPETIKKRMLSVGLVSLLSPVYLGTYTVAFAAFTAAPSAVRARDLPARGGASATRACMRAARGHFPVRGTSAHTEAAAACRQGCARWPVKWLRPLV